MLTPMFPTQWFRLAKQLVPCKPAVEAADSVHGGTSWHNEGDTHCRKNGSAEVRPLRALEARVNHAVDSQIVRHWGSGRTLCSNRLNR